MQFLKELSVGDPDQTPQNAASDLDVHCLHPSHKGRPSLYGLKDIDKHMVWTHDFYR